MAFTVIRGGRVLDIAAGTADVADILVEGDTIREIGPWTVEMLALHGLGRLDVVPAGDLAYLELVGRLRGRRVDIPEVREFFEERVLGQPVIYLYAPPRGASNVTGSTL